MKAYLQGIIWSLMAFVFFVSVIIYKNYGLQIAIPIGTLLSMCLFRMIEFNELLFQDKLKKQWTSKSETPKEISERMIEFKDDRVYTTGKILFDNKEFESLAKWHYVIVDTNVVCGDLKNKINDSIIHLSIYSLFAFVMYSIPEQEIKDNLGDTYADILVTSKAILSYGTFLYYSTYYRTFINLHRDRNVKLYNEATAKDSTTP